MTPKEYIEGHSKTVNNHLIVGPIKEDGPYCVQCFNKNGDIVPAPFDARQNGWICANGHTGKNEGYPSGTTF